MLQNDKLPPVVQSNLVIQLSGKIRRDEDRTKSYVLSKKVVESFNKYVREFNTELDTEEDIFENDLVDLLKKLSDEEDNDDGFYLKDRTEVMEQITEST